jgi:hypothetical protein
MQRSINTKIVIFYGFIISVCFAQSSVCALLKTKRLPVPKKRNTGSDLALLEIKSILRQQNASIEQQNKSILALTTQLNDVSRQNGSMWLDAKKQVISYAIPLVLGTGFKLIYSYLKPDPNKQLKDLQAIQTINNALAKNKRELAVLDPKTDAYKQAKSKHSELVAKHLKAIEAYQTKWNNREDVKQPEVIPLFVGC